MEKDKNRNFNLKVILFIDRSKIKQGNVKCKINKYIYLNTNRTVELGMRYYLIRFNSTRVGNME